MKEISEKIYKRFGYSPEFSFYNRDLEDYILNLFPDDKYLAETVRLYTPSSTQSSHKYVPHDVVEAGELGKISRGETGFFSDGSIILDIGSGGGNAVRDINKKYHHDNIRCIGVDIRYTIQSPLYNLPFKFVAGEWGKMPFHDNSFNRLLTYESFPRYALSRTTSKEDYISTFKEITRIAQPETIWRGTLGKWSTDVDELHPAIQMVKNGWTVYEYPDEIFIATLDEKNL